MKTGNREKKLAVERHRFMEIFPEEFYKEWEGRSKSGFKKYKRDLQKSLLYYNQN